MKSKYRNILIGTAIASVLGVTGVALAHGGSYGGNWQQGAQAKQGGSGTGPAMGMNGRGMGMMSGHGMDGHGMGMMGGQGMDGHGMGMMGGQGMDGHGMGMMGGMQGGMGSDFQLNLSDEQKAEMGKIRGEILPLMGELRGKMQANHEQLQDLYQSGATDQTAITTLADQKGDLIAEMIKLRSSHQARMEALLSEEQREQMRQRHQGMGMMGMGQMDG